MTWPLCSPPSGASRRSISSSTYLSPTAVRTRPMPWLFKARSSPRLDITVATTSVKRAAGVQRKRGQQHHGVAIHDLAGMRDEQRAIGVAVEGHAQIRAGFEHLRAQGFQMLRAAMQIDVASVRGAADGFDLRAQPRKQLRTEIGRRAVRGVDDDADAGEAARQGRRRGNPDTRGRGRDRRRAVAEPACRPVSTLIPLKAKMCCSSSVLLLIGQLEAGMIDDLDAVVLIRIVRGGDHDAGGEGADPGGVGQTRRGDQSGEARASRLRAAGRRRRARRSRDRFRGCPCR